MAEAEKAKPPFKLQIPKDGLMAFVGKGSPVDPVVATWDLNTLKKFLAEFGVVLEPDSKAFDEFKAAVEKSSKSIPHDFILVRGVAGTPAKQGEFQWIYDPKRPKDLVSQGVVFMEIKEPEPAKPGKTVWGKETQEKKENLQPVFKKISEKIKQNPGGKLEATAPGQVMIVNGELLLSPTYEVNSPTQKDLSNITFPCGVVVKTDLHGEMKWIVNGDLVVEGHWSASNIEVKGNAEAKAGLQTNMVGNLKIEGDLKASYVQRTKVTVNGNLKIENSCLVSELEVFGDIECSGSPGAIMGSKVTCHGGITANRVGSDRAVNTEIKLVKSANSKKTSITLLAAGTRVHEYGKKWIAQAEVAWECMPV